MNTTPALDNTDNATSAEFRLENLQQFIASLRIRSETGSTGCRTSGTRMVAVFSIPKKKREVLVADRDVSKRDERIFSLIRERGAMRLLGATASAEMAEAIGRLHVTHPNFSSAVNYILGEEMLARQKNTALCGLRILLHGAPGVGKTDFALTLADLLALPREVISMSSSQASAQLGGSEEYWSNSQPGIVWKKIVQDTHANPLFVLDEIDKTPTNWGDPLGALYQLLEQKSAAIFCDKSVPWLPLDTSMANWISTANDVERIHPALRSRFTEFEVQAPSENELINLAQRLYSALLAEFHLNDRFPAELGMESKTVLANMSVREAKHVLRTALAQALRENSDELPINGNGHFATSRRRIGFL